MVGSHPRLPFRLKPTTRFYQYATDSVNAGTLTAMANGKDDGKGDQHARFIEAARELGADDDEATFKAKLAVIARQKPKDEPEIKKSK